MSAMGGKRTLMSAEQDVCYWQFAQSLESLMKLRMFALMLTLAVPGTAVAKDKPLPTGIEVISAEQAKSCAFVDVVSAMRFAMISASKTSRDALIAALSKAKDKGANAAVITSVTAHNNQHQYTLTAYNCPPPSERG